MFNVICNIGADERSARIIIGIILLLGLLVGLDKTITFLAGVILIIEGIIGWCGTLIIIEKLKLNEIFKFKE